MSREGKVKGLCEMFDFLTVFSRSCCSGEEGLVLSVVLAWVKEEFKDRVGVMCVEMN